MKLESGTLIAIIRGIRETNILPLVEELVSAGITWVEVSLSQQEDGLACIRQLSKEFGDALHLGVGTVTRLEQVYVAVDAGATYIITPGWDRELVRSIHSENIRCLPGVFSPGEVMQAVEEGCQTVKLFPAGDLGHSYIKSLRSPFPALDVLAVGGVTLDNMSQFYEAGCSSFAIGSELVPRGATKEDRLKIREKAIAFQKMIAQLG